MLGRAIARACGWSERTRRVGAVRCLECSPSTPPPVQLINSCWSTLPNCVRVVTETTASPLAAVALYIEAGSRYETSCNNGATHFFEHMALKGFNNMTRVHLEGCLQNLGIKIDVHTDREFQAFTATCSFDNVETAVKYLASTITCFCFKPDNILESKDAVHREMEDYDHDARRVMFDHLHDTAYQGSTLGRAPIGPWHNYVSFDAKFLKNFVCQQYQPFRLIVSVSSVYCHDDVLNMVQKYFGVISTTTNKLVEWPCRFTGSILRYRNDDMPFMHMAMAVECGGYFSADYHKLHIMKHLVGSYHESTNQGDLMWPLLPHACEVSKLCVSCESFYLPYRDTGLWGIYFVLEKHTEAEDIIFMIQNVWMNMVKSVPQADTKRASNCYLMELANNCRGAQRSTRDMALQVMFWGKRYMYSELAPVANAVTGLELQQLAENVLSDRCLAIAAIGPTESIPEYNRIRQGMYWLRM